MHDLFLLRHRRKAELLVKRQRRRMVKRAGLYRDALRPVRPGGRNRSTEEPAANALAVRVFHHAEIGEFHFVRQMRFEVEEAGRGAVEVEHPDISVLAMQAGGQFLVAQSQHVDPVPFAPDPIDQVKVVKTEGDSATVAVTAGGKTSEQRMVKEGNGWKVDLSEAFKK